MPLTEYAHTNGLRLAYETFGQPVPGQPPVLLVMGLGSQMIAWPDELCTLLADRGFFVVRFDNRDIGLSTHLRHLGRPALMPIALGMSDNAPYRVRDMAADTVGLLDALGVGRVHLVGASMGGFISQRVAIKYPERVASLTSIMSTTGNRLVGLPKPAVGRRIVSPPAVRTRDEAVEQWLATYRLIASPGFPFDEAGVRDLALRSIERANDGSGTHRQTAAILAERDRTSALAGVVAPTTVIHGEQDPLINVSGGRATAKAIPGARLMTVPGMGHDLPAPLFGLFADEISAVARRAGPAA